MHEAVGAADFSGDGPDGGAVLVPPPDGGAQLPPLVGRDPRAYSRRVWSTAFLATQLAAVHADHPETGEGRA